MKWFLFRLWLAKRLKGLSERVNPKIHLEDIHVGMSDVKRRQAWAQCKAVFDGINGR
jgi:hypothetical protein